MDQKTDRRRDRKEEQKSEIEKGQPQRGHFFLVRGPHVVVVEADNKTGCDWLVELFRYGEEPAAPLNYKAQRGNKKESGKMNNRKRERNRKGGKEMDSIEEKRMMGDSQWSIGHIDIR